MKTLGSFGEMEVVLAEREFAIVEALSGALKRIVVKVEETAKSELGVYQLAVGPHPAWAELADYTKEERVKLGFTENDPLLRSGALRDSINHQIVGLEAAIGTEKPEAVYLEFGTGRMPARPFMGPAGFRNRSTIQKLAGAALVLGFTGGDLVHEALGYNFATSDI